MQKNQNELEIKYTVLWIDDEHDLNDNLKFNAEDEGIELKGYKSLEKGMEELKHNYQLYDAILLDAHFFLKESDLIPPKPGDTKNLYEAQREIYTLSNIKSFDIFVLTVESKLLKDSQFTIAFPKLYKKGHSDEEEKRLFADLKAAAQNQVDTQIRHNYKELFGLFSEEALGVKGEKDMLNILIPIEHTSNGRIKSDFNGLRQCIERLHDTLVEKGIIAPNLNLNEIIRFLAGKHDNYKWTNENLVHPTIVEIVKFILSIFQDGSHDKEELKTKAVEYDRDFATQNNYLYKSLVFATIEVLVYFGKLIKKHPNKEENLKLWKTIDSEGWVKATVLEEGINGWINVKTTFSNSIGISPKVQQNVKLKLKEGMEIEVIILNKPNISDYRLINPQ